MKKHTIYVMSIFLILILSSCSDKKESAGGEQELTISTFGGYADEFLNQAAESFESKNENVKITIFNYSEDHNAYTSLVSGESESIAPGDNYLDALENYRSVVNSDLMSGGGCDIYTDEGLIWESLAKKGYISDYNDENYFMNIIDGAQLNGKNYIMPIDFAFECFFANEDFFDIDELRKKSSINHQSLIDTYLENPSFEFDGETMRSSAYEAPVILRDILSGNVEKYVDIENRAANIDNGYIAEVAEKVKLYSEKGYLLKPEDYKGLSIDPSLNLMFNYSSYVFPLYIDQKFEENTMIGIKSYSEDDYRYFTTSACFVNSGSEKQDLAKEFIKFLTSEEMQKSPELNQNPRINKNAFKSVTVDIIEEGLKNDTESNDAISKEDIYKLIEADINKLNRNSSSEYLDIIKLIAGELDLYVMSETDEDLSDIITRLQSKVSMNLSE